MYRILPPLAEDIQYILSPTSDYFLADITFLIDSFGPCHANEAKHWRNFTSAGPLFLTLTSEAATSIGQCCADGAYFKEPLLLSEKFCRLFLAEDKREHILRHKFQTVNRTVVLPH